MFFVTLTKKDHAVLMQKWRGNSKHARFMRNLQKRVGPDRVLSLSGGDVEHLLLGLLAYAHVDD